MAEWVRPELLAALLLLALVAPGVLLLMQLPGRLWHGRWLRGGIEFGAGTLLLAVAAVLLLAAANILTYQRLTAELPVATLRFRQIDLRRFEATLLRTDLPQRHYLLAGDEWQLDARVLKWSPPAALIGFEPRFRLERLGGRYRDLRLEREAVRTVHGLDDDRSPELAELLGMALPYLPWVDTWYGSSAYMPMAHGAEFSVHVGQGGLVARPANVLAEQALRDWY